MLFCARLDYNQFDESRNKRRKMIIEDISHRRKPWFEDLYGPKTYTQCQNGIGNFMEWLVDELVQNTLMRPYTQAGRSFPIRKLVSQKFEEQVVCPKREEEGSVSNTRRRRC